MQIFLLAIVLATLVAIFWRRYLETSKDAGAGSVELPFGEWAKHTAIEFGFNILAFVALCSGLNIDFIIKSAEVGTTTDVQATMATIGGAIATGTAIYKGVQIAVLPLFNYFTGGATARKKLREKLEGN